MSARATPPPAFSSSVPLPCLTPSTRSTARASATKPPPAATNPSLPTLPANPPRRCRNIPAPRPDPESWAAQTPTPVPHDLPDLPADLAAHPLLSRSEEHDLLLKISFLQTEYDAHERLTTQAGLTPSDADLAAALSLSPSELTTTRRAALEARNHLVSANLRLVTSIANAVHRGTPTTRAAARGSTPKGGIAAGVSPADLVQEGSIALIRAAERFDLTDARSRFSTYAARAIYTACQRAAVPAACIVTTPQRLRIAARKLRILESRSDRLGEPMPEGEELSRLLGKSEPVHLVRKADLYLTSGVSLDDFVLKKDGTASDLNLRRGERIPSDMMGPEAVVEWDLVRECLFAACFRTLKKRDATIVVLRYGLYDSVPRPVKELSEMFDITGARVTQIVKRGLRKIRDEEPGLSQLFECI